jgi:cysteine-rich repeat protein
MLAVRESAAAPGPVGPELPAEDRPVPADGWWKSCTDARGVTTTIEADCIDERCESPTNVYVERTDANGQRLAPRLRLNDGLVLPTYYRVSCDAEGWVVAQWRDTEENCFFHRVLDRDGEPTAAAARTAPAGYDCRARPSVAVKDDGGFLAVWPAAKLTMTSGIVVQSFDQAGVPATDVAYVTEDAIGWNRQPKIAIDDAGVALVAWLGALSGATDPVFARFLDAGGAPLSPAMQLSTFEYGTTSSPTVSAEAAGTFLVVWSNPFQGGRVGRRVSLTGGGASTASANANASSNTRLPHFGVVRTVEFECCTTEDSGRDPYLGGDGDGTWVIGTRDGYYLRTDDDGVRWADRASLDPYGSDLAVGVDESGMALTLVLNESRDTLFVSRSLDGGATWSERMPLAPVVPDGSSCAGCWAARASVVGDGDGTWIAAWTVAGGERERIFAARSEDGGKTWGKVRTIDAGAGEGGFALATDDTDTWVIVWLDDDLRVSRSIDDGRTWSPGAVIASDAACDDCSPLRHFSRLQMTHDRAGRWVLVFASSRLAPATYGHDGDVFVSRSSDHGATWSAPAAIAPYATTDGSRENEPTIATDGEGRWMTMWTSYRPLGGADGMDADIVFAISTDAGATWTVPAAALADANSDAAVDWTPQIATDGRGAWMLTWKTWPFPNEGWSYATTYAAVADATCGNAVAEVGEACDDGNDGDGDGCDHDCSETGCGNGIVTDGEECDIGRRSEEIRCLPDCKVSRCGDGYHDSGYEECDDGNAVEDDGCTSSCQPPRCGDGTVQAGAEECDDGNWADYDACTNECKLARCGDGNIQDRVEACDDGQLGVPDDACPDTCDRATCGDGYTSRGFEECDPDDPHYASACSEDCRLIDLCGDADGDGEVTIIDVQHILGRGVGLDVWCPREPCDMNGDGYVRARDARMGIGKAVGLEVGDRCTLGTGNVIFWIDYEGDLGALQVRIDYAVTGGSFAGSAGDVACSTVEGTGVEFAAFNDDEHEGALRAAMISSLGFKGPADLFRCAFELPEDRGGMGFVIEIEDASTPEFERPDPLPLLGYRME